MGKRRTEGSVLIRPFQDANSVPGHPAGRDGFWLHRYLEAQGARNLVVDSASIEVSRRFRRVKTDRMDLGKLLGMLMKHFAGKGATTPTALHPASFGDLRRVLRGHLPQGGDAWGEAPMAAGGGCWAALTWMSLLQKGIFTAKRRRSRRKN